MTLREALELLRKAEAVIAAKAVPGAYGRFRLEASEDDLVEDLRDCEWPELAKLAVELRAMLVTASDRGAG